MRARLLTLRAIIGRIRRDTGGTTGAEGFEPQADSSLFVHDPGGPAWIRHVLMKIRDIFGEPDVKGDKGDWSLRPKTSRRVVVKRRIFMSEVEQIDRYNNGRGCEKNHRLYLGRKTDRAKAVTQHTGGRGCGERLEVSDTAV